MPHERDGAWQVHLCIQPKPSSTHSFWGRPKAVAPMENPMQFLKKNRVALMFAALFSLLIIGGVISSM